MNDKKFNVPCKSVVLPSGAELTYCEMGEGNKEVLLTGAFYFHTWSAVLKPLAEKFHIYGIEMRFEGPTTEVDADGDVNWTKQWGEDIYQFAKAMNLSKFHYFGKCHGTIPGWYLVKNHPEMLETFCSFFIAPHLAPPDDDTWGSFIREHGPLEHEKRLMRHQERFHMKIAEQAELGDMSAIRPLVMKNGSNLNRIWDEDMDALIETLSNTEVPICQLFGTHDPLYIDWVTSNLKASHTIKRGRTVLLQGERHYLEIDCPDRLVSEAIMFIDECKKHYE